MVFSNRRVALKRKECNPFFCLGAEGVQPCLLGFKSYFVASSGACARWQPPLTWQTRIPAKILLPLLQMPQLLRGAQTNRLLKKWRICRWDFFVASRCSWQFKSRCFQVFRFERPIRSCNGSKLSHASVSFDTDAKIADEIGSKQESWFGCWSLLCLVGINVQNLRLLF